MAKDVTLDHSAVIDRKEQVDRTLVGGVGATLKACHVDVVDAKASSPAAPPMAVLLKPAVKPIQAKTHYCHWVFLRRSSHSRLEGRTCLRLRAD